MRAFACLGFAAILSGAAFSQSVETRPTFEASDVHVSAPTRNPFRRGPINRGGRYELRTATMVDLISVATPLTTTRLLVGRVGSRWTDST